MLIGTPVERRGAARFEVTTESLRQLLGLLTSYGEVLAVRPDGLSGGAIVWQVVRDDVPDDYQLGRWSVEIERELQAYDTSAALVRLSRDRLQWQTEIERDRENVRAEVTRGASAIREHLDAGNVAGALDALDDMLGIPRLA